MTEIFNFSAGPATLPISVLNQIKNELNNWDGLGISVMEVSHRSKEFMKLAFDAEQNLRDLLNISDFYQILFCHGGARAQFSAVPMNLLNTAVSEKVSYINTGYWSYCAAVEAKKYCYPNIINACYICNKLYKILPMNQWKVSKDDIYVHYCPNETINGIEINSDPIFLNRLVIADCSSTLLSRPLNINSFGIIYASAQKNIGISGLTVVIIRKDLLKEKLYYKVPSILNYKLLSDNNSMFNTPTTISWYVANLMFKWLKSEGGLQEIYKRNCRKAEMLYNAIDASDFYYNNVELSSRSCMNVPFFLKDSKLENTFLQESRSCGLYGLQGHRIIGGIRASLYNAMTLAGVKKLVDFMHFFVKKYG